jgi:hypothetical protein
LPVKAVLWRRLIDCSSASTRRTRSIAVFATPCGRTLEGHAVEVAVEGPAREQPTHEDGEDVPEGWWVVVHQISSQSRSGPAELRIRRVRRSDQVTRSDVKVRCRWPVNEVTST